jgi:tellurite resistance protein TerC
MAGRFRYLNMGLGVILGFVGVKMLITDWYHFPTWASLGVITAVLTVTIVASLRAERRDPAPVEVLPHDEA